MTSVVTSDSGVPIRLTWEPFLLNPNIAPEGQDIKEYISNKYGPGALKNFADPNSYMYKSGREVGINFISDRNIYPTSMAHALVEHVKESDNDKANELMEVLFQKYFEHGENINSVQVLRDAASSVISDEAQVAGAVEAMQNPLNMEEVARKDMESKSRLRVSGVPFFIIDGPAMAGQRPIAFSGAQPPDIIAEQLEAAAEA